MAKGYNSWEQFYHRFNTIFHGIVALSLLPFAFVFLETQKEFVDSPIIEGDQVLVLQVFLSLIAVGAIYFARRFQKGIGAAIVSSLPLKDKLGLFLNRKLVQYAILQIAALAALIGLYLTSSQFFTVIYVGILFVYSLGRPTYDLVVRELHLNKQEEEKLKAGELE